MHKLAAILICLTTLPPLQEAVAAVVVTYRGSNPPPLLPGLTGTVPFDMNADGVFDFQFHCNGFFAAFDTYGINRVSAFIDMSGFYEHQIVPVALGAEIGPGSAFPYLDPVFPGFGNLPGAWHSGNEITYPTGFTLGYATSGFMQFSNAYIGVEFMAADGVHYGWIKYIGFSVYQFPVFGPNGELLGYVNGVNEPGGVVNEWAYESTPNTPIVAGALPEPSRAMLLLLGIISILHRRRRALGSG